MSAIPTLTAFAASPDRGRGLSRDTRVRWALEEVGQSYDVRLVSFGEMKEAAHKALHPFGQIPTYEDGSVSLFESGAIVLHVAEHGTGLLPPDARGRAQAIAWLFAALNTIEPPIIEREQVVYTERDKSWYAERLPLLEDRIRLRLDDLATRLGASEWLDGAFSVGDLMMISVLQRLRAATSVLDAYPGLGGYVARGEARPAYKRAFAAQLAVFQQSQTKP